MAGATVEVEGIKALTRTLKKAKLDISELKDAGAAAARTVAAAAAQRAPKISGKLASSIRGARIQAGARVQAGKSAVPYAAPIHWGWPKRGIAANPFISDAAVATEPQWSLEYRRDVERALAKVRGV